MVRGTKGARAAGAAARAALRLALALGAAALLACVSSGKYEKLAQERDALQWRVAGLEQERQGLAAEKQGLASSLDAHRAELSDMKGTYDGLVARLGQEVAEGKVEIERMRDGIRLNLAQDILFATGSAELDAQGRDVLGRVSEELAKARHRIEVEGHTDDVPIGGALAKVYPTNWELAGARAARVVRLFEEKGVGRERLAAVSFAEMRPVASNGDAEGRAKNRRIEIKLLPEEGAEVLPASLDAGEKTS